MRALQVEDIQLSVVKHRSRGPPHGHVQGERTHDLVVVVVEELEPVVLGVHHDHVAEVVTHETRWIAELAHLRPAAAEHLHVVSLGVEDVHAVQPEVSDVHLPLVEPKESALRIPLILEINILNNKYLIE